MHEQYNTQRARSGTYPRTSFGAFGAMAGAGMGLQQTRGVRRGGNWNNGSRSGAFTLNLNNAPSNTNSNIGFRCARYVWRPYGRGPNRSSSERDLRHTNLLTHSFSYTYRVTGKEQTCIRAGWTHVCAHFLHGEWVLRGNIL